MDQLPRLGKRELICLLSFACNYVVFVWRGFLLLWVLGMGYVILLWHSLSLPYNYFLFRNQLRAPNDCRVLRTSMHPRKEVQECVEKMHSHGCKVIFVSLLRPNGRMTMD